MALATNLVSYWKLDESSGNAADASGGGFTLTNNNGVTYSSAVINNGAVFTRSSSQYLSNTSSTLGLVASNFSFSFWIKVVSTTLYYTIIGKDTAVSRGYQAYNDIDGVGFTIGGTSLIFTAKPTLSTSVFSHIVITQSGTSSSIYQNGSLVGTATGASIPSSTAVFEIGNDGSYGDYLDGRMDEVGVWSRALTSGEVTQLYNGWAGIQYPFNTTQNLTLSIATAVYSITGQTITMTKFKQLVLNIATAVYNVTAYSIIGKFTGWLNQTKPTTNWTDSTKPTTNWTNESKNI